MELSERYRTGLIETINDRNKLSHVYKEEVFESVLHVVPKHIKTFMTLLEIFKSKLA